MEDGRTGAGCDRRLRLVQMGYTEAEAAQAAARMERMDPALLEQLDEWFRSGQLSEQVWSGFTVAELMEERGFTALAAFLYLDWVRRDPEEALTALASMSDQIVE